MQREIYKWRSPNLNKDMEIVIYGHYGYALLMFPTAEADYLEYERFKLIDSRKCLNPFRRNWAISYCCNLGQI